MSDSPDDKLAGAAAVWTRLLDAVNELDRARSEQDWKRVYAARSILADLLDKFRRGLTVWASGRGEQYVCRVEINSAGLALYAGNVGRKRLANASWERLVSLLSRKGRKA